jgi:DNA-binding response OmpR family regulator
MHILIIEDEEKLAESLREGLVMEGYAVDCRFTGTEGWNMLRNGSEEYDLIILDIMLPGMDGLEVCRRMRSKNIKVPVILLTARDGIDDRIIGLDAGADDYLGKPFAFSELLARIRSLLRRPPLSVNPIIQVRDLVVDTATQTVTRSGTKIVLTTKQFSLLEYFARNAGKVLSREDILAHGWDFSFDSFSNLVDAHVKNLRKRIDKDSNDPLFETIRGIGYRLKL